MPAAKGEWVRLLATAAVCLGLGVLLGWALGKSSSPDEHGAGVNPEFGEKAGTPSTALSQLPGSYGGSQAEAEDRRNGAGPPESATGFAPGKRMQGAAASPGETCGRIAGVVTSSEGTPLSGIRVACCLFSSTQEHTATTDGSGRFEFVALPPGHYRVWRLDSGSFETPRSAVDVAVLPGETARADIGGPGRTMVHGVFVGSPPGIEGADLSIRSLDFATQGTMAVFSARCDTDRRFEIGEVPPGTYFWRIIRVRQVPCELSGFGLVEVPRARDFRWEIALPRNLLSGFVSSADSGQPVREARVTLVPASAGSGLLPIGVVANEQGCFLMRGIPAGEFRISCEAAGHCPFESTVRIDADTRQEGYLIRLDPGVVLNGRLFDAEGCPLEATGEIVAYKDKKRYRSSGLLSGKDGAFSLEFLPRGKYDLHAVVWGFKPAVLRDVVVEEQGDRVLEFHLAK